MYPAICCCYFCSHLNRSVGNAPTPQWYDYLRRLKSQSGPASSEAPNAISTSPSLQTNTSKRRKIKQLPPGPRLFPTPYLELGSITKIHHQTPLIALSRCLKQAHHSLINLDNRTAPRIANALLHPTSIRKHNIHRLLQPCFHNRLEALYPVSNSCYIRLIWVSHEFFRCEVTQPCHGDAE